MTKVKFKFESSKSKYLFDKIYIYNYKLIGCFITYVEIMILKKIYLPHRCSNFVVSLILSRRINILVDITVARRLHGKANLLEIVVLNLNI